MLPIRAHVIVPLESCASPKLHPNREVEVFTVRVCLIPTVLARTSIWMEVEPGSPGNERLRDPSQGHTSPCEVN